MVEAESKTKTGSNSQNLASIGVTCPEDVKDSLHQLIWNDLPGYVKEAASEYGTSFQDCRIEYFQDYRILFITSEGLGVDMDHRGQDINYFQTDSVDVHYCEGSVEYIDRGKAQSYDSFAKISLFRTVWVDVVKQLGELKPGPGILQP